MKDRNTPCVHYVCAHAECAKGFKLSLIHI